MASIIENRFRDNLDRVRNLVTLYTGAVGTGQGRPSVREADILRAAVVFLHATVEDLLRSLAESKLPLASPDALSQIPFPAGTHRKANFTLGELAAFRGQTVDDVIIRSVQEYLERSNYNHPGDVKNLLDAIGIRPTIVDPYAADLSSMMRRRHLIVHRADRNESAGPGQHRALSISRSAVESWIDMVDKLGTDLLSNM